MINVPEPATIIFFLAVLGLMILTTHHRHR
ncbi:MAG: PEP-CTERM sorting domain-containing protein [Phycisphaerae bacterium]|nr:PEP-CTERM sorting domain-containing protein [Phycisphaerae bacterium]